MKASVREIDSCRKLAVKAGHVYQIHAARCPWSHGESICTCVPYHVFPSDDRPTAEIVATVERRKRA